MTHEFTSEIAKHGVYSACLYIQTNLERLVGRNKNTELKAKNREKSLGGKWKISS